VLTTLLITLLFVLGIGVAERGARKVLTDLEAALTGGKSLATRTLARNPAPLIEKSRNPPAIHRLLDALVILEAYPDPIPLVSEHVCPTWFEAALAHWSDGACDRCAS